MRFLPIAHIRHVKIQLETIDIITRLWGCDIRICMVYTIKPRSDSYCFRLNINILNVGYCKIYNKSNLKQASTYNH